MRGGGTFAAEGRVMEKEMGYHTGEVACLLCMGLGIGFGPEWFPENEAVEGVCCLGIGLCLPCACRRFLGARR